jgi:O-antigen biosynthesis protein
MQLSIIIVNYNVKHFLEHCLISVIAACNNIEAEIIVVDNTSTDGSVPYLKEHFPNIVLITNTENVGFAIANNQALKIAKGKYIVYLNPDTIVPEDCFDKCITYMNNHLNVGALGPHLIDGKGAFLPESKRGFPDFKTSFFKISGLSNLFKASSFFNKYHQGHLAENQSNEVDVLVGCFMMMPTTLAQKLGGFDEAYFMYGEDIDLSYRVQQAGYKNVYFADTSVIHYKGESTKKGSLNYVKLFYNAMIIFARKHLSLSKQHTFIPLIKMAIIARAAFSIINRFLSKIWLPILDAIIILTALWQTKNYWLQNIKLNTVYPNHLLISFFSIYVITWLSSLYFSGHYDKPFTKNKVLTGMGIGLLITLAVYGILPESARFSRGITVMGGVAAAIAIWTLRYIAQLLQIKNFDAFNQGGNHIITVASDDQQKSIMHLLEEAGIEKDIIGTINNKGTGIGQISNLKSIAKLYKASEIIYTYPSISFKEIIESIKQNGPQLNYKIHAAGTNSIIGSNSKNTAGDLYATDLHFAIATPSGQRNKRVFDVISSLLLILCYPFIFWKIKLRSVISKSFMVLINQATWIGYKQTPQDHLPKIKKSMLQIGGQLPLTEQQAQQLNLFYARTYTSNQDLKYLTDQLF